MIIRFPGGSSNTVSAKYVKGLMTTLTKAVRDKGYQYFDWNCDSTDASGNNVPVEKLVSNATSCTANHVDILMHDTDAKIQPYRHCHRLLITIEVRDTHSKD